jgi:hypothetical protein
VYYCYAISAKRYVLYRLDADGRPMIEHVGNNSEESGEETITEEKDTLPKWSEQGAGGIRSPCTSGTCPVIISARWRVQSLEF